MKRFLPDRHEFCQLPYFSPIASRQFDMPCYRKKQAHTDFGIRLAVITRIFCELKNRSHIVKLPGIGVMGNYGA